MNKLIYTVCTANYDSVHSVTPQAGFDFWLFTDDPDLKVSGWTTKPIKESKDPVKQQREIKINSHLLDYDITIYIDASMQITRNLDGLLTFFKGGVMMSKHRLRSCLFQEMVAIETLKKDRSDIVRKQAAKYLTEGMSIDYGLWESGIIIRDRSVKEFNELWWDEVSKGSHRDQLSLPYAAWKTKIKINGIPHTTTYKYFRLHKHLPSKRLKIAYIIPYSVDKNFGKAINDQIADVEGDDTWIVLRDGDTMFLTADWGTRIHESLVLDGDKFGLIGCYTNRLNSTHQLYQSKLSEDFDMLNHYKIALKYDEAGIKETDKGVAGCFMAFKKSTWKKVGKFKENDIGFDTTFNNSIREHKFKIGLMKNTYIFHGYRIWNPSNPRKDVKHLK